MVNHLGDLCEQVRYNNGITGLVLYQYADVNKPFVKIYCVNAESVHIGIFCWKDKTSTL